MTREKEKQLAYREERAIFPTKETLIKSYNYER